MKRVLLLMMVVLLMLSGITAVAADYEYTVNGIGISDETGAVYSQIPYGSDVNVTVSITKNVYSSEIPTVILTSYKNTGELYQTKMFKIENVQAMQTVELTAAMEAILGGSLKAFVWESVNNPVPRSNSITKKFSEHYIEIPNNDTSSTKIVRGIVTEEGDGYIIINVTERFDEAMDSWTDYSDSLTVTADEEFGGLLQYGIEAVISGYPTKPVLESVNTEYVQKYNKTANLSSEDILNIAEDKIDLNGGESCEINIEKLYINDELSDTDVAGAIASGDSVLLLCNNGSGIYNIAFVTAENEVSLLAANDKQYYNIEDICFENQDGSSVTALTPGEEIYIGAAITRIDSTENTAPEIVLNMRDADGAVTETVIFSVDKFRYNDTVIISGLFTVPENAEDSVITANVYGSIVTKNSLAEQFVKNLSDFNIVNEIKGNIISLRGTFNSQTNGVAAFTVKEALVNINGTKTWTTDFTDYVAENININLNNVDISDMTSGEALLEVSVKNGIITLISAEKLGGSITEPEQPEEPGINDYPMAENGDYANAVKIMRELDILKWYGNDAPLTRVQFAACLCKIGGLEKSAEALQGIKHFEDVEVTHVSNGYMAAANAKGYLTADADGKYYPNKLVSLQQAVTSLLKLMGYGEMASSDIEYITLAAEKGMLNNIAAKINTSITTECLTQLVYNSLEIPIYAHGGYEAEMLMNRFNLTKIEGVVYATSASDDKIDENKVKVRYDRQLIALSGQSAAIYQDVYKAWDNGITYNPSLSDVITISGTTAYAEIYVDEAEGLADEVKDLLDLKVVMYVRDADTEDATLVSIAPKNTNNDIVEFMTEDINDNKTDLSNGEVVVKIDSDEEIFAIDIDKIYINGRTKVAYDDITGVYVGDDTSRHKDEILAYYLNSNVAADIKLLNNDSRSDEYNIIYITAYKDYIVDYISAKSYAITSKNGERVIFDEENQDYRFEIVKDGEKVTFADIQINDVISFAGAFDTTNNKNIAYGTAIITSQQVSGKVKGKDPEEYIVTIGDQTYKYDPVIDGDIKLGDEVTMYLNARGVLVGIDKTKSNLKYGFVTALARSTGINDTMQIRLMDTEGTWKTLEFASKVAIDGASAVSISGMTNNDWKRKVGKMGDGTTDAIIDGNQIIANKMVAYELSSDGEINKIYFTPAYNDPDEVYSKKDLATAKYREATEDFGSVLVNEATIIFSVSYFSTDWKIAEDDVSIAKIDALVDGDEYANVTAINVDEDGYAAVLFGADIVGDVNKVGSFFTIVSKTFTTNDKGEEGALLKGIKGGEETELFLNDAETEVVDADLSKDDEFVMYATRSTIAALDKGDVILFSKTVNGDAKKVVRILDASDYTDTEALKNDNTAVSLASFTAGGEYYEYVIGFVSDLTDKRIALVPTISDKYTSKELVFSIKADATMAYYDAYYTTSKMTGRVDIASTGDIDATFYDESIYAEHEAGDIVFTRVNGDIVEDIVIIKQKHSENTMFLKGIFSSEKEGIAEFKVYEALIDNNSTKEWSSDFSEYVDEKLDINIGVKDITDILGKSVIAEVSFGDDNPVLIRTGEEAKGESEPEPEGIEFNSEDINEQSSDLNIITVGEKKYNIDVKKVYINGKTKVPYDEIPGIYAGEDTGEHIEEILVYYLTNDAMADIKLVSSGSNDIYDTVYITDYKDYVVDRISFNGGYFISKNGQKIILDDTNPYYNFEIIKDGKKISFADIKSGDVISIAGGFDIIDSKEVAYGKVYVTTEKAEGIIKTYDTEYSTITVGDTEYRYNPNYLVPGMDFRLGDETIMYLNTRGVIIGVVTDAVNDALRAKIKYGFSTVMAKSTGINDIMQIRLVDTEGTWKTMKFADKVAIDDAFPVAISSMTNNDWRVAAGKMGDGMTDAIIDGNQIIINKVIGYEVNSDDEINKIYFTPAANDPDELYSAKVLTTAKYREATEDFGSVLVNEDTVIFSVEAFETDAKIDEDDVSVAKVDALVDGDEYVNVTAINVDEDGYASVLSGADLVGAINKAGSFFTIVSKTLTANDEGDEGTLLKGIQNGEEAELFLNDAETEVVDANLAKDDAFVVDATASSLAALDKGDVILFSKAANGDAKKVVRILDASDYISTKALRNNNVAVSLATFTAGGEDYSFVLGFVSDLSGKRVALVPAINDRETHKELVFSIKADATMAYYDAFYTTGKSIGKVAIADAGDIDTTFYDESVDADHEAGDIIFARVRDSSIVDAVIIKQYAD